MATRALTLWLVIAFGAVASGCGLVSDGCAANDDCDDWEVCSDGTCVLDGDAAGDGGLSIRDGGLPIDDGGARDGGGSGVDGGPHADGGATVDGGQGGCPVVDDDVLTGAELPVGIGIIARHIEGGSESAPVAVDLTGTTADDGVTEWDFSGAYDDDRPVQIVAQEIDGFWFAADFPDADYIAPLDGDAANYGVFRRTESALLLLGVASAVEDETLLVYETPVESLVFPLELGTTFSAQTDVDGTFEGLFFSSSDSYEMEVDARGRLRTPAGVFDVWRLRQVHEVSVPILVFPFELTYRYVRYAYLSPCYGQVALVASVEDESENIFTEAATVRRLGLSE